MPRIGDKSTRHRLACAWLCAVCLSYQHGTAIGEVVAQHPFDVNAAASIPAQGVDDAGRASAAPRISQSPPDDSARIVVPPASETSMLRRTSSGVPGSLISTTGNSVQPSSADGAARGPQSSPTGFDLPRVLGALAVVIGLIILLRVVVGRYMPAVFQGGGSRPSGVLEVLARYPIGRGQQLVVLKFARRILLVHQAGGSMQTLSEMTDPDEVAATLARMEAGATTAAAAKFRATIKSFEEEHGAAMAQRSRQGAALAAAETEIIDLTRTRIGGVGGVRRMVR